MDCGDLKVVFLLPGLDFGAVWLLGKFELVNSSLTGFLLRCCRCFRSGGTG